MALTRKVTHAELTIQDGAIVEPLRQSVNRSRDAERSLHDDATAWRLDDLPACELA